MQYHQSIAIVSDRQHFHAALLTLDSIASHYGRELRVFVIDHGLDEWQVTRIRQHPLGVAITIIETRHFSRPPSHIEQAVRQTPSELASVVSNLALLVPGVQLNGCIDVAFADSAAGRIVMLANRSPFGWSAEVLVLHLPTHWDLVALWEHQGRIIGPKPYATSENWSEQASRELYGHLMRLGKIDSVCPLKAGACSPSQRLSEKSTASGVVGITSAVEDTDAQAAPRRLGAAVGTYAAVPYIHLQLEARRRFYPEVPLLVHDDASPCGNDLRNLCEEYGADFESNSCRQPEFTGDLTAFAGGLEWASRHDVDLLLKLSRRMLFRCDWRPSLLELARRSRFSTFGNRSKCGDHDLRTECLALDVAAWTQPTIFEQLTRPIRQKYSVYVEDFLLQISRQLERSGSREMALWRQAHPTCERFRGYAVWDLLNSNRTDRSPSYLWHVCNTPDEYARLSEEWGLPYGAADFEDPNASWQTRKTQLQTVD